VTLSYISKHQKDVITFPTSIISLIFSRFIIKNQNFSSLRINTMLSMRFTLVGSFIIDNHDRYLVANSNTLQYSRFLRLWFGIMVFG
jgi:hypothetical protein